MRGAAWQGGVRHQGDLVTIYALGAKTPTIDPTAFIHPDAVIIGDVTIGPESSVWPTAVLRGDFGAIRVGSQTSIQDGTVIHCTSTLDTVIGDRCIVGHNAHLEGCIIHDDSLVGSGSVVLHRASVGPHALVGANAVVGNDKVVSPFARALGVPAVITEGVVPEGAFRDGMNVYVAASHRYRAELRKLE
jgi:carbonic anhydrase/acetyltransferase-like protein (isoleucine patch superfamily)